MKEIKIVTLLALLAGCAKDPINSTISDNPNVIVDKLFTHDGCSVYRFQDNGYTHYFTNCNSTRYAKSKMCGKTTCTEYKTISNGVL